MASLELGCGEGYGGAATDSMSGNIMDAVEDVLQAGGDGVAASVYRPGRGGGCGMEGLDLRLQDWRKMSEKKESKRQGRAMLRKGQLTSDPGVSSGELGLEDCPIGLRHL